MGWGSNHWGSSPWGGEDILHMTAPPPSNLWVGDRPTSSVDTISTKMWENEKPPVHIEPPAGHDWWKDR